jgi:hypothetical protein
MPQPAPFTPSANPQSFAGLLASFAAPGQKKPPARELGRDLDGLEDDVATLSYERALRAHARYHAPEAALEPAVRVPMESFEAPASAAPEAEPALAEPLRIFEATPPPVEAARQPLAQEVKIPAARFAADAEEEPPIGQPVALDHPAGLDRNLKTASITIRLSPTECAQLRRRAAEAGLTVSAYLRSCTFETEALRALVKDTLAKMRTEGAKEHPAETRQARRRWRELLARLWPYARVSQRVAQA